MKIAMKIMKFRRGEEMNFERFSEYYDGEYLVRELGEYIEAHQGRCFGKPTFKGTRVLVHLVLKSLAESGQTVESVATDYRIPVEAVREALCLAADIFHFELRLPDVYPDEVPSTQKYRHRLETKAVIADKADE
jgi:uncharacterized protein (DUF433 family)